MELYSGIREDGYTVKVYIPTSIFEGRIAVIKAYRGSKKIDEEFFKLKQMPEWESGYNILHLRKEDRKTLNKAERKLINRLPKINRLY